MTGCEGARWTTAQARAALSAAPVTPLDHFVPPGGALLIVAPHPDDESLGCGGMIACAAQAGRQVVVACLTDGAASHPRSRRWPPARLAKVRRGELENAVAALADGVARVEGFGAPDGRLESQEAEAGTWLAKIAADNAFTTIFTTWAADPHPDHKAAFRLAARLAEGCGAALFAYPVWGLILPDDEDAGSAGTCLGLDISAVLDRKRAAVAAHRSQTGELIDDDPDGFRLRSEDLARHLHPHETFIQVHSRR